ncbi:MAG: DUF1287 domain-containing protein [Acidobacteria bacterium]|nr:DUF1287 domain-containing protein [Acidobacteriota bacterium]
MRKRFALPLCLLLAAAFGCSAPRGDSRSARAGEARAATPQASGQSAGRPKPSSGSPFLDRLSDAAVERTSHEVRYDPTYFVIPYPNGDVPAEVGVCTDEVIRSYRALGVDLQQLVHEDMKANFALYPRTWGLKKADPNIDHRRVPNLMVFFARQGAAQPVTDNARDYKPGDVVTWDLGNGLTHIGIVVAVPSESDENRLQIVHNIGAGPKMEDVLFDWKITGHYRFAGPKPAAKPTPQPNARRK